MSETHETPAERRLRVVHEDGRIGSLGLLPDEMNAIDAGREAIALLRKWDQDEMPQDGPSREWRFAVEQLLARCGEDA